MEYVDGGARPQRRDPLDAAQLDGYERFLVVMTRTRDYVKKPRAISGSAQPDLPEAASGGRGAGRAVASRYNATREELLDLESSGKAVLYFPDQMPIENQERRVAKLRHCYALGMGQINREWPRWRDFLGI